MNNKILSACKNVFSHSVLIPLVLFFIMLAGFLVRFDDLQAWQKNPEQTFYQGSPLLTTFDGYFYLNLARELLRGEYDAVDEKQVVPDGRARPYPPPLLSVLGAACTKITGASLDMVGTILPALLGVLLAIPLYLLGRYYGGCAMGLTASLSSLFFPYYVYRSNVGWFDTDCMNVTFATFIVFFTLKFALHVGRVRYLYGFAALVSYLLFLWWWDQAFVVVSVIFFAPLLIALVFYYRPGKKEGYGFLAASVAILCLMLFWKGIYFPEKIWHSIEGLFNYIYTSKTVVEIFPNQAITVSEQVRPGFTEIIAKSTGSKPIFFAACAGLLYLFYRRPKESLFLIIPLLLASFSFLFAKRFLIFLNPLTALGLGSFISAIWMLRKRYALAGILAPICALLLIWPNLVDNMSRVHWPKEPGVLVAGMAKAEKLTPKDAIIWTWWDHGYNMRYWSDRGVIADGSHHGGDISLYNALPMTVSSERLSANFMHFYAQRGQNGMEKVYQAFGNQHGTGMAFLKKILSGGPEGAAEVLGNTDILNSADQDGSNQLRSKEFYFPSQKKPVYLFLDWRLTVTSYWWYWFGSWDFDKQEGKHPVFELFRDVTMQKNQFFGRGSRDTFQADFTTGVVRLGKRSLSISRMAIFEADGTVKAAKFNKPGPILEVSHQTRSAALVDGAMANSVFNKLFVRRQYDQNYFELVDEAFPAWQLWKVRGDE